MCSFRNPIVVVFLFWFGFAINSKAADPNYLYHICENTTTFTPNSTYQSSLNLLLSSLASYSTSNDGFHNTTIGQTPDTVYGLFLCYGYVSADVCQDCVTYATKDVVQRCPVEKAAVIWYDECLLRYSYQSFFNNITEGSMLGMYNTSNGINRASYQNLLRATLDDLLSQAASNPKRFAVASSFPASSDALYTVAQCTHDLSVTNCHKCLQVAMGNLQRGVAGARTMTPNCFIRYESYPFYNQSAAPNGLLPLPSPLSPPPPLSLPPPASGKGVESGTLNRGRYAVD